MHPILVELQHNLSMLLDKAKNELHTIRTNRPHPGILENINVEYYGALVQLKTVASLSIVPPREIDVNVYDKNALNTVVKSLEASELGFSIQCEGGLIRVFFSEMSVERREELTRYAKQVVEGYKIEFRRCRDEGNKKLKSLEAEGSLREDDLYGLRDAVQAEIDKAASSLDVLLTAKIKEIHD